MIYGPREIFRPPLAQDIGKIFGKSRMISF
jgi:hypothetical protein